MYGIPNFKIEFQDRMGGFYQISDAHGLIGEVQILPLSHFGTEALPEYVLPVLEDLLLDEGITESIPLLVLNSIEIEEDRQGEGLAKICIREAAMAQLARLNLPEALILPDNMIEGGSISEDLRSVYEGALGRMQKIKVIDESGDYPIIYAGINYLLV